MKRCAALGLAGFMLLMPITLVHAQVQLAPVDDVAVPEGHSFILGLGLRHVLPTNGHPDRYYLFLHTTQETFHKQYEGGAGELGGGVPWQKLWDITQFGIILYEESLAVRDSGNDNLTYFTGGNTGNRLITWQQTHPAVLSSNPIAQFQSIPQGMVTRASSSGSGPSDIFYSTAYGNGVDPSGPDSAFAPALVFHPDVSLPLTALPEYTFGTSGPGKVSSGVGALQLGPDGLLNVLDTGDQRIIRYNPNTFEYAGEFSLGNTNTDRNTFAISSNGYLFTAHLDSAGGSIYNYYTGEFVGTYGATSTFAENGQGGKTSIVADSLGSVIAYNHIGTEEHIYYYDANQLPAAVPEPSIASLLAGSIALAAASSRRRRKGRHSV